MKKRLMSILLILCMVVTGFTVPVSAAAPTTAPTSTRSEDILKSLAKKGTDQGPVYNENDVTWLGSKTEYKKTLEAFFDSGLRRVPVGDLDAHGNLTNVKYGLVDRYGVWAAQPIYDKIEAYYVNDTSGNLKITNQDKSTEAIFVNGYVQAVRNGKMGLLDSTGKEVIPCKYDEVGLPSEGISRIIVGSADKDSFGYSKTNYIGYWNLKLGKEIVAPKKYIIPDSLYVPAAGAVWLNGGSFIAYDFHDGYALVNTGKTEKVTIKCISGIYGKPSTYTESKRDTNVLTLYYAQIIDKNGKEILPKAYLYNPNDSYPQAGPYLAYAKHTKEMLQMRSDASDDIMFDSHIDIGVVGAKGVIISAKYHGSIVGNSAVGWRLEHANMEIIPKLSMVITNKNAHTGLREGGASRGVVSFANKTIVPFYGQMGSSDITYDDVQNVFINANAVYRTNGAKVSATQTKVTNRKNGYTEIRKSFPVNGYVTMTETVVSYDNYAANKVKVKSIVSVKKGTVYSNKNLQGIAASDVSTKNTLWVNKGTEAKPKWGLVNLQGKIILPFEYEEIATGGGSDYTNMYPTWTQKKNAYALVKKGGKWGMVDPSGKLLLTCKYSEIGDLEMDNYVSIQDASSGKYGVYSFKSKKITVPCKFDSSMRINFREDMYGSVNGVISHPVSNNMYALIDIDTGKQVSDPLLGLSVVSRGTFATSNSYYGPDGKMLYPMKISEDCTLVVSGDKVGYINASRLAREGKSLSETPAEKPATPTVGTGTLSKVTIGEYPDKKIYRVGEGFDTTGLVVYLKHANGDVTTAASSDLTFFTSGTVELTQGRPFTTEGVNNIEVLYQGTKYSLAFDVKVIGKSAGNILEDGNYYFKIYGKYLYPVQDGFDYPVELSDKKPDYPFTVKLVDYDAERGPCYDITYHGGAAWGVYNEGDRFKFGSGGVDASSPKWRINQYSSFCTIRDYKNQKLLVNASGQNSANGTKVIVWKHTGSAPENGKVIFTKVN